ncbi:MAG TPA: hypothetical protein VEL79_00555 [Vicinamibacterales bacterium]|nr:hypothetical protein [Vicinamibacterales bacterium]
MIDLTLEALGVDARQWRALVRTYVKLDFRTPGGAVRSHQTQRRAASPLVGLAFITAIGGLVFAFIAAVTDDVLLATSLLTTYAAANTMMLLLVDFTGVVISPDDYGVLGHRPVASRTYFAARMAAIGVYVGTISLVMAAPPAIVYAMKLGPAAAPATVFAVLFCNLTTAVLVITGYVALLRWVHPGRLRRAMSYLQLAVSASFYATYYLATVGLRRAAMTPMGFERARWLWAAPSTWFAAFVPVAAGRGSIAAWIASLVALLLTAACVPLAAGRLSLDYARRVGEMSAAGEPAGKRRAMRLPGFRRGEARAVALLVRAQFRFDNRFRMAILSILPLTGFYLLLGSSQGALQDPFSGLTHASGPGVFFAIAFIPLTLHGALTVSESWRASWIFFATPASHARIVVATKNFVTVYFLGSYLAVLASFWSFFFDRAWHAAVHALFAGLLAHLLLQLTVIARPALPFAAEPRKAERSFNTFGIIIVGSIAAGVFPFLLPIVYQRVVVTIAVLAFMLAVTAALEYALRQRVSEAIGELEFLN